MVPGRCNGSPILFRTVHGVKVSGFGSPWLRFAWLQLAVCAWGQNLVSPTTPLTPSVIISDATPEVGAAALIRPAVEYPIAPLRAEMDQDTYMCAFRMNDHITGVFYNGVDIRKSAAPSDKMEGLLQLELVLVPGAFLVIAGFDEEGNMGDTGGFWADCESAPAHKLASSWQSVCAAGGLPHDILMGQGDGWKPATLHAAPPGNAFYKAGMLGDFGMKYCAYRMVPLAEGATREGEALEAHEVDSLPGEGEGEHGEAAEGAEHEHCFAPHEIAMAIMLLGAVFLIMTMFYMVNWNDDDIRRYSWQIISSTVSIFVSVLTFRGIEEYLVKNLNLEDKVFALFVHYLLFFVLFVLLQALIAYTSGANCEADGPDLTQKVWVYADSLNSNFGEEANNPDLLSCVGAKGVAVLGTREIFLLKTERAREIRHQHVKANATIIAHMTGFAAINMGGCLMHLPLFSSSWPMAALSLIINQVLLYLLFKASFHYRHIFSALDGVQDDRDEMYLEEVQESENDIYGLSMSFLFVQVVRFWLTGSLPTSEGHDVATHLGGHHTPQHPFLRETWHRVHHGRLLSSEEVMHPTIQIIALYAVGIVCAVLVAAALPIYEGKLFTKHEFLRRPLAIFQIQVGMVSAWCILWASHWTAGSMSFFDLIGGLHSMAGKVVLAVALSALSVLCIGCLDKVQDSLAKTSDHSIGEVATSKFITSAITSLGILVGFSWEHCFDGGVSAIASLTPAPHLTKLLLAVVVVLVITPAWRMYILTKEMVYKAVHEEDLRARSRASLPSGHIRMNETDMHAVPSMGG
mmetsp:Transcript_84463/g.243834  ORF Transcript_84463/g.243834 Transcript_84463/m.243834 type:complete len:802 (+) Transcript_84463:95-2500(+)